MSDVSKTNGLIAEARFYESAGHVAAYAEGTLELLRNLADALEAAGAERDAEIAAKAWDEGWDAATHGFDLPDSEPGGLEPNPHRKAVQDD